VKTRPDADCGSDHELLIATVRIKLKNTQQTKKGWKLDIDNIPEEYKTEIKQKLAIVNLQGEYSEGIWKALKDTFKEVAEKTIPKKEKKKTHLDVTRHVEGRGEQATNEDGRKLGRSKKTKWRNIKEN
jgi:hypothetical protein